MSAGVLRKLGFEDRNRITRGFLLEQAAFIPGLRCCGRETMIGLFGPCLIAGPGAKLTGQLSSI